ncbi:MFS transporter [Streptomyces sp. NPDC057575]|uniref:MFS transporter n=1 Tax=unclassified Streptomyces TaxID=2593676 RepID=UPI00368E6E5E
MHAATPAPFDKAAVATPPAPGKGGGTSRRRRQLGLLSAAVSTDNGEQNVVSVMFPAMRSALGLPLVALGVLGATTKLAGVVFGPLWVTVAQRYPRKHVLAVCAGLWGVWTLGTGLVQNYAQLVVMSCIAAAGAAGSLPLVSGIVADLFEDKVRGRANGFLFGAVALFTGILGPALGQLSRFEHGWRYGFFAVGTLQILTGLAILRYFKDPGVGAAEPQLAALDDTARPRRSRALDRQSLRELWRIRSFPLMCLQRLLGGQFVLLAFGVVFLVDARGFSNAAASIVTLPASVSYLLGTLVGGLLADRTQHRFPRTGRIAVLQADLLAYAAVAFVTTQFVWPSLAVYAVLFSVLGALMGVQPSVNRPIVMSIVPPELRGAAFAVFLAVESVGWAAITLLVGRLGDSIGLDGAFLWVLVVLILVAGLLASPLYRTYGRDVAAVQAALDRQAASTSEATERTHQAQQER